jgi:hypothetical protein
MGWDGMGWDGMGQDWVGGDGDDEVCIGSILLKFLYIVSCRVDRSMT